MKLSFSVISYSALWRQETLLQQELQSTREELSKKEQGLRSMIGKVSTISSKNICSQDHQTSSFFFTLLQVFPKASVSNGYLALLFLNSRTLILSLLN